MFGNYITIAYRNMLRHKSFSLINIFGLTIGMAAGLLILQYVTFQLSFDQFHANRENIYRVALGEEVRGRHVTPPALKPLLQEQIPQVKDAARLRRARGVFSYDNAVFAEEKLYYADASFLNIFTYPLLKGNATSALLQPNTVVLSESAARKYFGNTDPMGKVMQMGNPDDGTSLVQVTGVLKDLPQYSHLQFDILLSYTSLKEEKYENAWDWRGFTTYVQLHPAADPQYIAANLPTLVQKVVKVPGEYTSFWLQPLSDIHLSSQVKDESVADIEMLYFLLILALFILLIAWINYINMSTARAAERAKEVGVRKAIGASRYQLFKQFFLESILLNGMAILIAFTFVQFSLPFFRKLTGLQLSLTLWSDWRFWLALLVMFVTGTFFSGMYPALVLSAYKPVAALKKGTNRQRGGLTLRKSLVVFQFAASVTLMAGTFIVYTQMQYMRNQDLGMDINQTLIIKGPELRGDSAATARQWNIFKMQMQQIEAVRGVTVSDAVPARGFSRFYNKVSVEGMPATEQPAQANGYAVLTVDTDFLDVYAIPVVAGRNFSKDLTTDATAAILNQQAAQQLGFTQAGQAIGQQLRIGQRTFTITGVIKNYHHDYLKNQFSPVILRLDPSRTEFFSLKVNTGTDPGNQLADALSTIRQQWKQIYPGNPFDYFFLDEAFNEQYLTDQQLGSIIASFASLAIFVAYLGLFGLASFTTARRTKEIGVRKVLGANQVNILILLNKDLIKLIGVANIIAWPLAWWGMHKWLDNYAFPIALSPWLFILPSLLVLIIALLTVSLQTLKAARTNPVDALRSE